jgi:hypothetical protein
MFLWIYGEWNIGCEGGKKKKNQSSLYDLFWNQFDILRNSLKIPWKSKQFLFFVVVFHSTTVFVKSFMLDSF